MALTQSQRRWEEQANKYWQTKKCFKEKKIIKIIVSIWNRIEAVMAERKRESDVPMRDNEPNRV